ncbi:MAG: hypothetical protein ACLQOO_28185 [Terriglobia bacterium]
MEHPTAGSATFSLPGSRLARAAGKPARRSQRRKVKGLPFLGAIVPMRPAFSERPAQQAAAATASDMDNTGTREQEWLRTHWREYVGLWVALDGDRLIGQAVRARDAMDQARAAGVAAPFLIHVMEPSELPFGGW